MYELMVGIHVAFMLSSLLMVTSSVAIALLGGVSSVRIAGISTVLAVAGTCAGALLILHAPVLSQCVMLTAYLASVIALYKFGFGWGAVEKSRLLRRKLSD